MTISAYDPRDTDALVRLLVDAFAGDPLLRHIFADAATRPEQLAWYMRAVLRLAAQHGEVRVLAAAGVIAWFCEQPPDWFRGEPPPHLDLGALRRLRQCLQALERLRAQFTPAAHLHAVLLATDATHTFDMPGEALARYLFAVADAARLPIVAETSTRGNVRYFKRLGFTVAAEAELPGGPPVWLLVRACR
jgi:hypothetical protein